MKRSILSMLVIGLLAALLASCGASATGNQTSGTPTTAPGKQTVATPTASSHAHTSRIAWQGFLDPDESTSAIFSATASGSDVRQLTHTRHGVQDGTPDWSPDGSKILFTHILANGTGDVWVMNADGTGQTQLTSCTGVCNGAQEAKWSPDGSQIVYDVADNPIRPDGNAASVDLWLMHADGSRAVQLTHTPLPTSIADNQPTWSPDGKRILFSRNHLEGQSYDDQALFVIKLDGSGLKQLTAWGHLEAGNGHWSPDGKRILFQSLGSFPDGTFPQLYTMFADGTHLVQLTTSEKNYEPAWSPDGTKIIFSHRSTKGTDQNAHVYEMNADGSGLVQITRNPFWQRQPAWGPLP
ncbi:MAG: hypothetical protein ACXVBU_14385 [Ktedonobacteraceae bacterium]